MTRDPMFRGTGSAGLPFAPLEWQEDKVDELGEQRRPDGVQSCGSQPLTVRMKSAHNSDARLLVIVPGPSVL
jgi:hypothetical protein